MSAIAVGSHYFGFRTAYGDWTNWLLGGTMTLIGVGAIFYGIPTSSSVPFAIAAIEIAFRCWFIGKSVSNDRLQIN